MSDQQAGAARATQWLRSRRGLVTLGVVVVVLVLLVAAVVASRGDSDGPPGAGPTQATPEDDSTDPAQPEGSDDPVTPAPQEDEETAGGSATLAPAPSPTTVETQAPVALDEPAEFGDGVTARIVSITPVEGEGQGVGEVSGPSLLLELELSNDGSGAIDVGQSTVLLAHGADETPATILFGDRRTEPLSGRVGPGDATTGRYVFTVPRGDRGRLSVTVSHAALSPVVAFEGAPG